MNDPFARGGPSFIPPSLKTSKRGRPYTNDPIAVIPEKSIGEASTEAISSNRNQLTLQQQIQNRNRNNPFYSSESTKEGTSQGTVKFNRNRFHPLSSTKAPTITTTTARTTTLIPSSTTTAQSPSTETNDIDSNRSRLAALTNRFNIRAQNSSNGRSNKLLRQPLYTSRESNTPIGVVNSTIKKINVTHNGSSNRDTSSSESSIIEATTSSTRIVNNPLLKLQQLQQQRNQQKQPASAISDSDTNTNTNLVQSKENDKVVTKQNNESEKGEKLYDDELEEYDDEDYENENDADSVAGYEEESEGVDVGTQNIEDKSENKPVILTSNFFLPATTTIPTADLVEPINEDKIENESPVVVTEKSTSIAGESDTEDAQPKAETKKPIDDVPDSGFEEKEKAKKTDEVASNPSADVEYEYEYEYEDETTTPQIVAPTTKSSITSAATKQAIPIEETTAPATDIDYYETTTIASSISLNGDVNRSSETIPTASPDPNEIDANSTESYVVVASVQTSRSISGARFLPFPQVEQEEKKQSLADLEKDDVNATAENDNLSNDDLTDDLGIYVENHENETATFTTAPPEETTVTSHENGMTQEAITDQVSDIAPSSKLHKLSSVSEKLAHLHDKIDNVEVTTKGVPVVIRKFMPRTTKMPHKSDTVGAKNENSAPQNDESSASLPPGFKFRANSSYKNGKITTTTSTTTESNTNESETIQGAPIIEVKNKIQFKEIALDDLLPKDYKSSPAAATAADSSDADDILAKLLPDTYKKSLQATTKAPLRFSTVTEDVSKFLPPGFKSRESTSKRPLSDITIVDDISKFLPPGFRLPKTTKSTTTTPKMVADSKFLPPGFKESSPSDSNAESPKISFSDDISKLLPPGFALNETDKDGASNVETKIKLNTADISSFLPPGFSLNKSVATSEPPSNGASPNFKIVFPKGIGKRPGSGRATTSRPLQAEGPLRPGITIRKGLPIRFV